MTATLINPTGERVSDATISFLQNDVERMSALVSYARIQDPQSTADEDAEARLWEFPRLVRPIKESDLPRDERRDSRVAFVGMTPWRDDDPWDRLIWTDQEPHHNVARVFIGSDEVEDD